LRAQIDDINKKYTKNNAKMVPSSLKHTKTGVITGVPNTQCAQFTSPKNPSNNCGIIWSAAWFKRYSKIMALTGVAYDLAGDACSTN